MWPQDADRSAPLVASANAEGTLTPSSMREPVRHLGELLGALSITKKPRESITATEEKLVRDLAAAEGTRAEVSLTQIDGHLRFAVVDDGTGFDTAETSYGTGVQGMADRLDTIGGALQVVSRKGGGTTIEGQIPTPKESR